MVTSSGKAKIASSISTKVTSRWIVNANGWGGCVVWLETESQSTVEVATHWRLRCRGSGASGVQPGYGMASSRAFGLYVYSGRDHVCGPRDNCRVGGSYILGRWCDATITDRGPRNAPEDCRCGVSCCLRRR